MEPLEGRTLLAATDLAAITGTAFLDATDNGLSADDTPLSGVSVQLYRDGGNGTYDNGAGDDTLVGTQTTGAVAQDLVSYVLQPGEYRFNNLTAGTYFVRQSTSSGALLQRSDQSVQTVTLSSTDVQGVAGTSIDSFNTTTSYAEANPTNTPGLSTALTASGEAIGGERDLYVQWASGAGTIGLRANQWSSQVLVFDSGEGVAGTRIATWDGLDGDATTTEYTGLGNMDLTADHVNSGFRLISRADLAGANATLRIYTNAANWSWVSIPVPVGVATQEEVRFFSDFAVGAGTGADFTNVGAVQLEIEGSAEVDGRIDELGMIGPTLKTANFANLQPLSLGDRVWLDTNNNGLLDSGESGIANVALTVYQDDDGTTGLSAGDAQVATTTTDATGHYVFSSLLPGSYVVQVDAANLIGSGPLVGLVSSTGNEPTPDPDDDVDNDDNGDALSGQGVVTQTVSLTAAGESVSDGDQDSNTNLTVDFGFTSVADVLVLKADQPDPVVAGQNLTYALTVTNNGPSPATSVVLTDPLPSGVSYVSAVASQGTVSYASGTVSAALGTLASGASATVTLIVHVDAGTTGPLSNTATVQSAEVDPVTANNTATEPTNVSLQVDVAVAKADNPDPVVAGETLTYTITVTNNGPSNASGVTLTDPLPTGVTYSSGTAGQGTIAHSGGTVTANLGSLASGASTIVTVVVTVDPATRGTLTNTATVSASETETNAANNTATVTTTIEPHVDLAITKNDSPDPVVAGQQLTYTLTVSNAGPSTATNVTVQDVLPTGVTFQSGTATQGSVTQSSGTVTANLGTLAVSGTATITLVVAVGADVRSQLTNTATVTAAEQEDDLDNNTATATTQVTPQVDLAITKSDSPDPVVAGQTLTYTITVTNNGPSAATGVTVSDTLPTGLTYQSGTSTAGTVSNAGNAVTATIGNLSRGGSATVTVVAVVDAATTGSVTNTATVAGNETETNQSNNTATQTTTINPQVDVAITKTDSSDPVVAGQPLTYTLTVTNNGPSVATGVTVEDMLPSGLTYTSGSATQGTVSQASGTVTATIGTLTVGQSVTVTLVTQIGRSMFGTITNVAEVSAQQTETVTTNNTASQATEITALACSIAGYVYLDANDDGQKGSGETPLAGVTVRLTGTDASGTAVSVATATGADGSFLFDGLRAGTYDVVEVQPSDYGDGKDTAGTVTADTTTSDTMADIQLDGGVAAADYLFGERPLFFSKRHFLASRVRAGG
jgi:uncharacterized repeat protein (TIGR01451 family)